MNMYRYVRHDVPLLLMSLSAECVVSLPSLLALLLALLLCSADMARQKRQRSPQEDTRKSKRRKLRNDEEHEGENEEEKQEHDKGESSGGDSIETTSSRRTTRKRSTTLQGGSGRRRRGRATGGAGSSSTIGEDDADKMECEGSDDGGEDGVEDEGDESMGEKAAPAEEVQHSISRTVNRSRGRVRAKRGKQLDTELQADFDDLQKEYNKITGWLDKTHGSGGKIMREVEEMVKPRSLLSAEEREEALLALEMSSDEEELARSTSARRPLRSQANLATGGAHDLADRMISALGRVVQEQYQCPPPLIHFTTDTFLRKKMIEVSQGEMVNPVELLRSGCGGVVVHAAASLFPELAFDIFNEMCYWAQSDETIPLCAVAALSACLSGNTDPSPSVLPVLHGAQLMGGTFREKRTPSWYPTLDVFLEALVTMGFDTNLIAAVEKGLVDGARVTQQESSDTKRWSIYTRCGKLIVSGELNEEVVTVKDVVVASLKQCKQRPQKLRQYTVRGLERDEPVPHDVELSTLYGEESNSIELILNGDGVISEGRKLSAFPYVLEVLRMAFHYENLQCSADQRDALLVFMARCAVEPLLQMYATNIQSMLVVLMKLCAKEHGGTVRVAEILTNVFLYHRNMLMLLLLLPGNDEWVLQVRMKAALLGVCKMLSAVETETVRSEVRQYVGTAPDDELPPVPLLLKLLCAVRDEMPNGMHIDVPTVLTKCRLVDLCLVKPFSRYPEAQQNELGSVIRKLREIAGRINTKTEFDLMRNQAKWELTNVFCTIETFCLKEGIETGM